MLWVTKNLRRPVGFFISLIYGACLSLKLTGAWRFTAIRFSNKLIKVNIKKQRGAKFILHGNLIVESFLEGTSPINIILAEGAILEIKNDFVIGQGVTILVYDNAKVLIGGKENSSASGITADTKIMAEEKITIGKDVIIGWDVVITDSDWHTVAGQKNTAPVIIEDNVWLAHGVSVLKNSVIGSGSMIAAKGLVSGTIPSNVMAAGIPAKTIKDNFSWSR